VLYLFLLADLLCSAAAFPVFFGLFNRRHNGLVATIATICGLVAGLWLFPAPGAKPEYLLESFLLAALVPAAVTAILLRIQRSRVHFDFSIFGRVVRSLDD
jgi:Na+/proline symporter